MFPISLKTTLSLTLFLILNCNAVTKAEPQRYALVVGVRSYPLSESLTTLSFTEPDATEIATTLQQRGVDVTLMTQQVASQMGMERFAPNADFIRKEFQALVRTPYLKKHDCIMIVLEGHGIQLPSKDDSKKQTYYFCPADAKIKGLTSSEQVQPEHNLIPVEELYATLNQSKAGVKLLVIDACRNDPNKRDVYRSANSVTRPPVPKSPGGIAALFSCSAGEKAVEDPTLKHGVFSYYLIEGLSGKADTNRDGQLTITELNEYVGGRTYNYVRTNYKSTQLPQLASDVQGFATILSLEQKQQPVRRPIVSVPGTPMTPGAGSSGKVVATTVPQTTPMKTPVNNVVVPQPPPRIPTLPENPEIAQLWEDNSLKLKLRWCPPGKFLIGSPDSEYLRQTNEDQASVRLTQGFWVGQYEVTQSQWTKVMGTTIQELSKRVRHPQPLGDVGDNYPMAYISWNEVREFCTRLTKSELASGHIPAGWEYRIPTEAQWEYACRAGTQDRFCYGYDKFIEQLSDYAWWGIRDPKGNTKLEKYPHEVGQKKPNAWNLYDVHGNVLEWARDRYHDQPTGGTDPEMKESRYQERVIRGGGFQEDVRFIRCAVRFRQKPDLRFQDVGLRVILTPAK